MVYDTVDCLFEMPYPATPVIFVREMGQLASSFSRERFDMSWRTSPQHETISVLKLAKTSHKRGLPYCCRHRLALHLVLTASSCILVQQNQSLFAATLSCSRLATHLASLHVVAAILALGGIGIHILLLLLLGQEVYRALHQLVHVLHLAAVNASRSLQRRNTNAHAMNEGVSSST